ncbi:ribosome recycling factor [Mycoplasmoides fastidiosum]|uniref:Ribosome recycling factor n=1 Tax=Mycoplasmoides fastidiosum TaxID=92758 RepID=A0ABU0LZR7_9BACT|nr:ribosome-recycling factor [Mycoplasmoides fastidiosum]MDQ0514195.1 ribosome recycling factor [Mycoplasmoides fastidiosum]UUD37395.1 ribosome-recycling factor [Mycoplasmoides fastidiosum]
MNQEWKDFEAKFNNEISSSFEWLKNEYKKIRVGRANPALVEGVRVEAYGQFTPLNQLANVQVQDATNLIIKPYDPGTCNDVVKAIIKFNNDLNPIVDNKLIRITIAPPNEESRKKSVKVIKEIFEKNKIAIRNARKNVMQTIKGLKLQEGLEASYLENLEKAVKKANEEAEAIFKAKEKDLLTI